MPSKMREGKELPARSPPGSPSVLSQLATPLPAIQSDMSQVIDNTPATDDSHDEAFILLDKYVPLVELLDAHIVKPKEYEIEENHESRATPSTPATTKMLDIPDGYTLHKEFTRELMAYDTRNDIEGFMAIVNKGHEHNDKI